MREDVWLGALLCWGVYFSIKGIRYLIRAKKYVNDKKHCNDCKLSYLDDKYKYCAVCGKELTEYKDSVED